MSWVTRRVARSLLLLGALVAINFILPRALPGSPLAGGEVMLPAEAASSLRALYGLDEPLPAQFVAYLDALRRGDLGRSLATHRAVTQMIAERLPWTLLLVGAAVMLSAALGCWLGTIAAVRPRAWSARLLGSLAVAVGALPEFLVAMVLIAWLAAGAQLFPAGGAVTPFAPAGRGALVVTGDVLRHAALPVATLAAGLVPAFFLLSRAALAGVLGQPYLVVAQAKGLPRRRVLWHAWRNAAAPVVTLFGLRLGVVVTGAAVVERVFAYPGVGMLLFDAVTRRDYPVLQGVFLVSSAAVLGASLVLDLVATRLDPRLDEADA